MRHVATLQQNDEMFSLNVVGSWQFAVLMAGLFSLEKREKSVALPGISRLLSSVGTAICELYRSFRRAWWWSVT